MPTYPYFCDFCRQDYEEFRFIEDPPPFSCPTCGEVPPIFHQVFAGCSPMALIKGSPRTFGQQAELNSKKMGSEQMAILAEKSREEIRQVYKGPVGSVGPNGEKGQLMEVPKELPWYRSGETKGLKKMAKPLNTAKIKDVTNYVLTGETK